MIMRNRCYLFAVLTLALSLSLPAQTPAITTGGTVNGADYSRDFAPGAIISIFGTNLATTTGGAVTIPLPTTLAGASRYLTWLSLSQATTYWSAGPLPLAW